MKKIVIAINFLVLSINTGVVLAECVGPIVNGRCLTGIDSSGRNNNSDTGYQGSSGSRYEYDMSNGSDRNRYSIDLDAQRRDQMNTGVGRSQDQMRGQYGGGIYND